MKGLLIFISIIGLSWGQTPCPPAYVIFPCECREPSNNMECVGLPEGFNLKEHFDNITSRIDSSLVYESLTFVYGPSPFQILEGAVEHLKFSTLAVFASPLVYISPRAFGASRNVTHALYILNNTMELETPRENDVFEFIRGFENLGVLVLEFNGLTSIPDNAFQNLPFLGYINLKGNNISQIGARAFQTEPYEVITRQDINLSNNHILSDGLNEDAFEGISSTAIVNLECNKMRFMEQKSFQTLLDRARAVYVGCQDCGGDVSPCIPVELFYCDERADWICDQRSSYERKLFGFNCNPGSGPTDIWEYCDGRNGTIANSI